MPSVMRIAYILFSCLFVGAVLKSFLVLSEGTPTSDYIQQLNSELGRLTLNTPPVAQTAETRRKIAHILWQQKEFVKAAAIFSDLWGKERVGAEKYSQEFMNDALSLANVYLDEGAFAQAFDCYKKILDYDRDHFSAHDLRIARDLNNLSVAHYLAGSSCTSEKDRRQYFELSRDYCIQAGALYQEHSAKIGTVASFVNASLIYRDLGLQSDSSEAKKLAESELNR